MNHHVIGVSGYRSSRANVTIWQSQQSRLGKTFWRRCVRCTGLEGKNDAKVNGKHMTGKNQLVVCKLASPMGHRNRI